MEKWHRIPDHPTHFERSPAHFPNFQNSLSDLNGSLTRWLDALHIVPLWAKEWRALEKWEVGPRTLDDSSWIWFSKGEGILVLDQGKSLHFGSGDLILIPKGVRHRVQITKNYPANFISVHFFSNIFGNIDFLEFVGFPFYVRFTKDAPYSVISRRLARISAVRPVGWSKLMATEILNLLFYLIHHHGNHFQSKNRGVPHQDLLRLMPALKQIEDSLSSSQIRISDLARTIAVSERHFRKIFFRTIGMSPVLFIQQYRIQNACTLLKTTTMNIKQIAEATGFSELPFFYRIFKKWMKKSPLEYRLMHDI